MLIKDVQLHGKFSREDPTMTKMRCRRRFGCILAMLGVPAAVTLLHGGPPGLLRAAQSKPPAGVQRAAGRVLYVSPAGKDTNPGTREKPWATPGHGSKQLRAGDTLVILSGQ